MLVSYMRDIWISIIEQLARSCGSIHVKWANSDVSLMSRVNIYKIIVHGTTI